MTKDEIIALVKTYETLLEDHENSDEDEYLLEQFLSIYPGIPNYDSEGNWIGPVSNENGWTP
jgi:hypothetical protein